MCDTVLATSGTTARQQVLFGKNSDRQRNEAQAVEFYLGAAHTAGASLACTYISVPQVANTYSVLLCRPFWIWGAEMGANEHGVVIGNEGLHARSAPPEKPALIGMDLLRLALERARTAAEAVRTITALLEEYGQGGNCGHLSPAYYNNGFIVTDPNESYVLETIGREWLVERVDTGVRTISNAYSVGEGASGVSDGLDELIRSSGWSTEGEHNYAKMISNPNREHIGNAGARRQRSTAMLAERAGGIGMADIAKVLRDHGSDHDSNFTWPAEWTSKRTVCMHAGAEDRQGQTVGSMISELGRTNAVHWVTATSAPCISIYRPVLMDVQLPAQDAALRGEYDPNTVWWRHERLHRKALFQNFAKFIDDIHVERDEIEAEFRKRVQAVLDGGNATDRARVVKMCWQEAAALEQRWEARLPAQVCQLDESYRSEWQQMNKQAVLESVEGATTDGIV